MEEFASLLANATRRNPAIKEILRKYISTKNVEVLKGCTFSHIVYFLDNKPFNNERFSVALMDFGLTKDSILGKTGVQVAEEWLATL